MIKKELSEATKQKIRAWREKECFPIVNRGTAWYNKLTKKQKDELQKWYQNCLDATETGIVPAKPAWLK